MLNSEVPYVRCLIGWITKTFDYINRVKHKELWVIIVILLTTNVLF